METIQDFEDMLVLLEKYKVRYLISIKNRIDHPRHREDVRVLREVQKRRSLLPKKDKS